MFISIYDTKFLNSIQWNFRVYKSQKTFRCHGSYWYFCSKMCRVIGYS